MARPIKEGLDYFPHDTDASTDEKIEALRVLYGNNGYAFYFIILERIFRTNNFEIDISDAETIQILARKVEVTVEEFNKMLKTALKWGCFDNEIYKKRGILTSNGIKKRAEVVIEKREKMRVLYHKKDSCIVSGIVSDAETGKELDKVKESKVKESKVIKKDNKEVPITTFSDPKENILLINNEEKEKKKPNNIEFDFELWSWHGIDNDIMERWGKIFPNVEVSIELNKMREYFKSHRGHEKIIKEKFKNNYANYIFDWLERAKRYREKDAIPVEEGG